MILSHINGENLQQIYKKKFEIEIELNCLNYHFLDNEDFQKKLEKYKFLNNIIMNSLLKESEFFLTEIPYYEMSIFCNKQDFLNIKEQIESNGCIIDLIHFNGDSFSLNEFTTYL